MDNYKILRRKLNDDLTKKRLNLEISRTEQCFILAQFDKFHKKNGIGASFLWEGEKYTLEEAPEDNVLAIRGEFAEHLNDLKT